MKLHIIIYVLLILLFGCSSIPSNKDEEASTSNKTMTTPSQEANDEGEDAKIYSFEHFKTDVQGYYKFQTFDEFSMEGKGKIVAQPYVLVKRIKDTIVVKSSLSMDSMRVYYKLPCGTWYSHMEYDLEKKMDLACKCEGGKTARTYDRYIYNDTIAEIENGIIEGKKYPRTIVKTPKEVFVISSLGIHESRHTIDHKYRSYIYDIIHSAAKNVSKYKLTESSNMYSYESDRGICAYQYSKKAYGLWGIQPGLDETYMLNGQDIRNASSSHNITTPLANDTTIYDDVDLLPEYPEGNEKLHKVLTITVHNADVTKNEHKLAGVAFIVEKDGSITNLRMSRSLSKEYDQMAMDLVKRLPRFLPAYRKGKKVRCKYGVAVLFNFTKS